MKEVMRGFFFLFKGARALVRVPRVGRLLVAPIALNVLLFAIVAVVLYKWGLLPVIAWSAFGSHSVVITWFVVALVVVIFLLVYAFVFPIVAEVIGAPFYEAIGEQLDRAEGVAVVERGWRQEVMLMVGQESRKLAAMAAIGLVIVVLQFAPVVGQILSAALGFFVLVMTLGSDAVAPALARRGMVLLRDRRAWVRTHWHVVAGLGAAKALGLFVPILNIVVLPMAAAGGTLLVQQYDET